MKVDIKNMISNFYNYRKPGFVAAPKVGPLNIVKNVPLPYVMAQKKNSFMVY